MSDSDLETCRSEACAIQLNPGDEHAHALLSIFLAATSEDLRRAVSEMQLALQPDPLFQYVNANMAWIQLFRPRLPAGSRPGALDAGTLPQFAAGVLGAGAG